MEDLAEPAEETTRRTPWGATARSGSLTNTFATGRRFWAAPTSVVRRE
jgi:hypothetical protein